MIYASLVSTSYVAEKRLSDGGVQHARAMQTTSKESDVTIGEHNIIIITVSHSQFTYLYGIYTLLCHYSNLFPA